MARRCATGLAASARERFSRRWARRSIHIRLTRATVRGLRASWVRLFARTKVTQIEEQGEQLKLRTAGGHTVTAAHVAVCAGYESLDFLPDGFADVNNTFALVTEPLSRSEARDDAAHLGKRPALPLSTGHARRAPHRRRRRRAVQERRGARPAAAAAGPPARGTVSQTCLARNCRRWPTPGREASRRPATACR